MGKFYVEKLSLENAKVLEEQLQTLLNRELTSGQELEQWLKEQSNLIEAIQEILSGHYIDFQCHNDDEEAKKRFEHDQEVIQPLMKKYEALFDEKFYNSPYRDQLDQSYYAQFIKSKVNSIELFREENIALEVEEDRLSTEYFKITGSMTVEWEGEEKTLNQMAIYMKDADRSVREKAWKLVQERRLQDKDALHKIMDQLIAIRQKKAENADLANYRDYMFKKYERFSYTPEDCHQLAHSIKTYVVPLKDEIEKRHQQELGLTDYRPWDVNGVPVGMEPLKPFHGAQELIEGTAKMFQEIDPVFADLLLTMNERKMLDLESRKAKSPGGFCSSLPVSGHSFIFMNAANTQGDLSTLVHEMGHCVHNYFVKELPLANYKSTPMESAELASMTMELFSMDQWSHFYKDETDLKRAKREQLEGIVKFLPWGIVIDQFQHWLYENPSHTAEERNAKFRELALGFSDHYVDWNGNGEKLENLWLRQLHIFEVPFYYIEYVIAQLGAVQMYKQYKENPKQALENYKKALALGSSKPLPEVYEAAGIKFDFSPDMVKDLMEFVKAELVELY